MFIMQVIYSRNLNTVTKVYNEDHSMHECMKHICGYARTHAYVWLGLTGYIPASPNRVERKKPAIDHALLHPLNAKLLCSLHLLATNSPQQPMNGYPHLHNEAYMYFLGLLFSLGVVAPEALASKHLNNNMSCPM